MAQCPEMDGARRCELGCDHLGPHIASLMMGTVKMGTVRWPVDPPVKPEGEKNAD